MLDIEPLLNHLQMGYRDNDIEQLARSIKQTVLFCLPNRMQMVALMERFFVAYKKNFNSANEYYAYDVSRAVFGSIMRAA